MLSDSISKYEEFHPSRCCLPALLCVCVCVCVCMCACVRVRVWVWLMMITYLATHTSISFSVLWKCTSITVFARHFPISYDVTPDDWHVIVFFLSVILVCLSDLIRSMAGGTWVAQWLRHCATNRKVAGSIPDGVTWIFHLHNPSGRTMALGLTQPLTEPCHLHVPIVLKSGSLNFLEPSWPVKACNGIALPSRSMAVGQVLFKWT
jgi:hypothetical protein